MEPLTRKEWDAKWWELFRATRQRLPEEDLLKVRDAVTKHVVDRFGPRPPGEGPPWWAEAGALVTGVPLSFLTKVWDWLNGKKVVVGVVITSLALLADQLGVLLPVLGVEAVLAAKIIGVITAVVGVLHKIYKFLYKEEHP